MTLPLWCPASDIQKSTVAEVADGFEAMAAAARWFEGELREICASPVVISQASVNRLVALGERMRPAAAARTRLASLEPAVLLAGIAEWVHRQQPVIDGPPDLDGSGRGSGATALTRAQRIWATGSGA